MLSPVTIQRIRDSRMECITGHAYDISEAGMRIELDGSTDPGDHLTISVALPNHSAEDDPCCVITAVCEVVWVNDADDDPVSPRAGVRILRFQNEGGALRLRECFGGQWLRLAA